MRKAIMIAGLLIAGGAFEAQAADFHCKGAGRCLCTEAVNAKSAIGYNATADGQSVNVDITCINMKTMDVAYYTVRKQDGLAAHYGQATSAH